jgi:hypothetical protein
MADPRFSPAIQETKVLNIMIAGVDKISPISLTEQMVLEFRVEIAGPAEICLFREPPGGQVHPIIRIGE